MYKHCTLVLEIDTSIKPRIPLEVSAPEIFVALSPVFSPRVVWAKANDESPFESAMLDSAPLMGQRAAWRNESIADNSVLTLCPPGPAGEMMDELRVHLAKLHPKELYVGAEGALKHIATGGSPSGWYGRWKTDSPPALLDLVAVRFEWSNTTRTFEFDLPNQGYPFTSVELTRDGEIVDGDPLVAARNRSAILPTISDVSRCLQLEPHHMRWSVEGDFGPLYPEDYEDLHSKWLPHLNRRNPSD